MASQEWKGRVCEVGDQDDAIASVSHHCPFAQLVNALDRDEVCPKGRGVYSII